MRRALIALGVVAVLAACSGGGTSGSSAPPPTSAPSASVRPTTTPTRSPSPPTPTPTPTPTPSPTPSAIIKYRQGGFYGAAAIAGGPDNNLWFASSQAIGRLTTSLDLTVFPIPEPSYCCSYTTASGMTAGADGALWFGTNTGVGRITTTGALTFRSLYLNTAPVSISALTLGPDRNHIWFQGSAANQELVGYLNGSGHAPKFVTNAQFGGSGAIANGPDGNVWFGPVVGRVDIHTGGIVEFGGSPPGAVVGITAGPGSELWFTTFAQDGHIARVSVNGTFSDVVGALAYPSGITMGPDGNVWACESGGGPGQQQSALLRVTPSGTLTRFFIATSGYTCGLTTGPDGNIWFASDRVVGELVVSSVIPQLRVDRRRR
jgi:streptogramin lyase